MFWEVSNPLLTLIIFGGRYLEPSKTDRREERETFIIHQITRRSKFKALKDGLDGYTIQ